MTTIMSLYIPHVFTNIDEARIVRVFDSLSIGKIKHIDFVAKTSKDGASYNAAYIHLDSWHDTVTSQTFQERVINPDKEARLVYDEPWYWIVLENRSVKRIRKTPDTTPIKNHFIKPKNKIPLTFLESVKRNLIGDFDMEDTSLINVKSTLYDEERHIISIDSRYVQQLEQTIDDLQNTTTQAGVYSHENDLYQYKISVMQDEIDSLRERITMLEDSQFNSIV